MLFFNVCGNFDRRTATAKIYDKNGKVYYKKIVETKGFSIPQLEFFLLKKTLEIANELTIYKIYTKTSYFHKWIFEDSFEGLLDKAQKEIKELIKGKELIYLKYNKFEIPSIVEDDLTQKVIDFFEGKIIKEE